MSDTLTDSVADIVAEPVTAAVRALVAEVATLTTARGKPVRLAAEHVLTGRAARHGWRPSGQRSANGSARLLRAADGWLAVNLARPVDVESVPAVLGRELTGEPWDALAAAALTMPAAELAAAAQLLGVPAAVLGSASMTAVRVTSCGSPAMGPHDSDVRLLDLSALWAGPLCAHILGRAGAQVTKVEDMHRPDGARFGSPEFYAELHEGHDSVVLDFADTSALHALAEEATIVLESSRPRALRSLGLVADDWLRARPGRIWISITGYGRDDPAGRVAFGDDAAVAGGLVDSGPRFCGDAIADPLSGLYAAIAGLNSLAAGGGHLVDVAMAGVSAHVAEAARTAVGAGR
jgi:hypothetical protein